MFFIICMLGACTAEELAGPESGVEDDAPVVIAISPADITSVNMNSRAAGDNSIFSVIDDVNVKVNYGGNTVTVYLVKNGDSFEVSGSVENGSAGVVSSKTADGKVYIHINAKQGNQAVRVEVIANYGRKITLSLWQSVKESLIQWPVDFDETSACLLYGASEQFIYTENPHEGAQGGNKGCYLAKVSLKRPYAMIKVNINTSGLDNEVTLTPRSVQLCNVPKTCTLASDNSITDFTSFDKEGQKYDFPSGSLLTGPSGNGETQVMSERLYQFENKQTVHAQNCTDAQNGNEKAKTPNRIKNTMEAGKEVYAAFTDYTDNENLGRRCSYILVTADYEYKSSSAHVKGTISYRLFLGKNISYDFDVNRNTIYNVTLHLRGAGGVKESGCMDENGVINISGNTKDAQWRVDSELSDLFIQFNEGQDYNIDGHLVKPNHWYHIKITNENNRVSYYIDGERLVDFRDAEPLREGWFGFRTTLSRTRITNFSYECSSQEATAVPLQWIGETPRQDKAVSFGVPFDKGEVFPENKLRLSAESGEDIPIDTWTLAYWPDGSVKWGGIAGVIPAGTEKLTLEKAVKKSKAKSKLPDTDKKKSVSVAETSQGIHISTGVISAYIPRQGEFLIDSLLYKGVKVGEKARLICHTQSEPVLESTSQVSFTNYIGELKSVTVERAGSVRALVKLEGVHKSPNGREWLPFVVRLYFYGGSEQVKMVHSFVYDGDQNKDFIRALGVRFDVPMREALYNRHVAFSCADGGVWSEPVQPLVGRRILTLGKTGNGESSLQQQQMEGKRIPSYEAFDEKNRALLDHWASWDSYRLSQLTADAFSIRKRANDNNPWIGTFSGTRSEGYAFAGDITGGMGLELHDFWQSYPSSIEISDAKTPVAALTAS